MSPFVAVADPSRRAARNLDALLNPASIAVIGATERPGSVGAAVVRNLIDAGFAGSIVPINRNRKSVFGLPAFPSVAEVASRIALAIVCTPASAVPTIVRECGDASVGAVVIITAGFRETGPEGAKIEDAIRAELTRFPCMRILGPNCVGLIIPSKGVNASFLRASAQAGGIAFLSQSGALCAAILGWAEDEGLGFSHFISVGNMVDVGFGDLLDAMADDPQTTSIVLYVEAITDAKQFVEAARRCTTRKPVIAYKAGRSAAGAQAAGSHTGAMAGEDVVYQAAFEECGIIRVNCLDDLLSTAELLGRGRWPRGGRLGIVTNAGGPGVIAADALIAGNGVLAPLSESTISALNALLPSCWSHGNPVDVIGDAPAERLASALQVVARDDHVDALLAIVTPQAMIDVNAAAQLVADVACHTAKPVLASWMGGSLARHGVAVLQAAGVPTYDTPEQAVEAFLHLAAHAAHLRKHAGGSATIVLPEGERLRIRQATSALFDGRRGMPSEIDAKSLLSLYGIHTTKTILAAQREEAISAARSIGYPVVLKVFSPQITHKTDVDGVRLNLRDDTEVAAAFDQIKLALSHHRPDAHFQGVTVQRMIDCSSGRGLELILGVKRDATFGPIVLVGAGGIFAEVINDRAIGLAPVTIERAREMLRSLRTWPLLQDFRNRGPLNAEAAANAVARMSHLIADSPEIQEADANPILVTQDSAVALDARVMLDS
jgi:acetyltransferase